MRAYRDLTSAADRSYRVTLADGTQLQVLEQGDPEASLTVLLAHGWTLDSRTWRHQFANLATAYGRPVRVLAVDNRGHGQSDPVRAADATIPQVAEDLARVIEQAAPTGRLVLVGHSLGGMAILALAQRHPELMARVAAVALVATSAGGLAEATLNLGPRAAAARLRMEAALNRLLLSRGDRPGRLPAAFMRPGVRWLTFGTKPVRAEVRLAAAMVAGCSPYTIAAFRAAFDGHDEEAVLPSLGGRPVLVMGGTRDRLTPFPHSQLLADLIPGAELVRYEQAGHMLPMERAVDVTDRLAALLHAAAEEPEQASATG